MERTKQELEVILAQLQPLTIEWEDDVSASVMAKLAKFPVKNEYTRADIEGLLDEAVSRTKELRTKTKPERAGERPFDEAILIIRLFLGLSDDSFNAKMNEVLGKGGIGVKRFQKERDLYIQVLSDLGLAEAITVEVNRVPQWYDVLRERLRSGRGSAVTGIKRGNFLETKAEEIVKEVFPNKYELRCDFLGKRGARAKCDIAIPNADQANIILESKGYGATGSKMSDVTGDIGKIIEARRADTVFLFLTDGITWRARKNDLRKIVAHQNEGDIAKIYTLSMAQELKADLMDLKATLRV